MQASPTGPIATNTHLHVVRQRTVRVRNRFLNKPVRLVPTMTPAEVLVHARKSMDPLIDALQLDLTKWLRDCPDAYPQRLFAHTTAEGMAWWVLFDFAPTGTRFTALLRYRRPDQRQNALLLPMAGGTAYHFGADLFEHCLRLLPGPNDPAQRTGRFLLENHQHHCDVVATPAPGMHNVVSSLHDELIVGTWDTMLDLVCYNERFGA